MNVNKNRSSREVMKVTNLDQENVVSVKVEHPQTLVRNEGVRMVNHPTNEYLSPLTGLLIISSLCKLTLKCGILLDKKTVYIYI